jgi:hypothetical protein
VEASLESQVGNKQQHNKTTKPNCIEYKYEPKSVLCSLFINKLKRFYRAPTDLLLNTVLAHELQLKLVYHTV